MDSVELKREGHLLNVSLNRPEIHNAFDPSMIKRLTQVFKDADADTSVRCILLRGNGKSFCAGADLEWMKSMVNFDLKENTRDSQDLYNMFEALRACRVPIVARVQGSAMGGGLGLLAACDIVAAERESRFAFSEARLGLVPSVISSFVMRKANVSTARPLMLTAEVFNCVVAEKLGVVHFYGEPDEVEDFIQTKIDFILANGPEAVRTTKQILSFVEDHSHSENEKETIKTIAERRVSAEGQEGIKAFLEKRKASWTSSRKK